jgi:hypothetical protein
MIQNYKLLVEVLLESGGSLYRLIIGPTNSCCQIQAFKNFLRALVKI